MEKTCTGCGQTKPIDQFFFRRERRQHYARCKDCFAKKRRRNYQAGKAKELAGHRKWWAANAERARAVWREMARRKRERPGYRVHLAISNQIWCRLRGRKSGRKTFDLLGYTADQLMAHLERQFQRGMSWQNFGQWHIDHITPLSSFKIGGPDDPSLRAAWALPNLRPLWSEENIKKREKRTHLL